MLRRSATSTIAVLLAGAFSLATTAPSFAQEDNGRHGEHRGQEHRGNAPQPQAAPQAPQAPQPNFSGRGHGRPDNFAQQNGEGGWRGRRFEQRQPPMPQPAPPQAAPAPQSSAPNVAQRRQFDRGGRDFAAPRQLVPQPGAQPAPQQRDFTERRFDRGSDRRQEFAGRPAPQQQFTQHDERRDVGRRDFSRGPAFAGGVDGWRDHRWIGPRTQIAIRRHDYRPAYYRPHYFPRERWFRDIYVRRPYGLAYPGFGFYYTDDEAWRWLGLSALSFVAYSDLDEMEQRAADEALIEATQADIGESITWNEDNASGSVTPIRDGETADGRPCREFQEDVMIGGRRETAYGTACMQPDGSWQVVND